MRKAARAPKPGARPTLPEWVCLGRVDGWCGKHHVTYDAALACLQRASDEARSTRGWFTDRQAYEVQRGRGAEFADQWLKARRNEQRPTEAVEGHDDEVE